MAHLAVTLAETSAGVSKAHHLPLSGQKQGKSQPSNESDHREEASPQQLHEPPRTSNSPESKRSVSPEDTRPFLSSPEKKNARRRRHRAKTHPIHPEGAQRGPRRSTHQVLLIEKLADLPLLDRTCVTDRPALPLQPGRCPLLRPQQHSSRPQNQHTTTRGYPHSEATLWRRCKPPSARPSLLSSTHFGSKSGRGSAFPADSHRRFKPTRHAH